MKSPVSLVTNPVLQGVPKVTYHMVCFSHFATKWRLCGVFSLHRYYSSSGQDVFRPINQSINQSLYLRDNGIGKGKASTNWEDLK